jgi:ribosomal protein L22
LNINDLYIDRIDLWRGMKIKRMRFASRSRIHGYVKHRSFVRVVLDSNNI